MRKAITAWMCGLGLVLATMSAGTAAAQSGDGVCQPGDLSGIAPLQTHAGCLLFVGGLAVVSCLPQGDLFVGTVTCEIDGFEVASCTFPDILDPCEGGAWIAFFFAQVDCFAEGVGFWSCHVG